MERPARQQWEGQGKGAVFAIVVALLLTLVLALFMVRPSGLEERSGSAARVDAAVSERVTADETGADVIRRPATGVNAAASLLPPVASRLGIKVLDTSGAAVSGADVMCILGTDISSRPLADIGSWDAAERMGQILARTKSDESGRALLIGLPVATVVYLEVMAEGYARAAGYAQTPGGGEEASGGTFQLRPGRDVALHFVDEGGASVPQVRFHGGVYGGDSRGGRMSTVLDFSGTADVAGKAQLRGVPDEDLWLRPDLRELAQGDHVPLDAGVDSIDVVLRSGEAVYGTVVTEDGSPLVSAEIAVHPVSGPDAEVGDHNPPWAGWGAVDLAELQWSCRTDENGRFRTLGLAPGRLFTVTAWVQPNQYHTTRVLDSGAELRFVIPDLHDVTGTLVGVENPGDCIVEFEQVWNSLDRVHDPDPEFAYLFDGAWPECSDTGAFSARLPEGIYSMRVRMPGALVYLIKDLEVRGSVDLGHVAIESGGEIAIRLPQLRRHWQEFDVDAWLETADESVFPLTGELMTIWLANFDLQPDCSEPGVVRFRHVSPGRKRVVVTASGALPALVDVGEAPPIGEVRQLSARLEPASELHVRVFGQGGIPMPNLQLRCVPVRTEVEHPAHELLEKLGVYGWDEAGILQVTAGDGVARFLGLAPGTYGIELLPGEPEFDVNAERSAAATKLCDVEIGLGTSTSIEVTTAALGALRVEVLEGDTPAAGALVDLWPDVGFGIRPATESALASGQADASGVFEVGGLGAGRYLIGVRRDEGDVRVVAEVGLAGGQELVRVALPTGGIQARVTMPDGRGVLARVGIARVGYEDGRLRSLWSEVGVGVQAWVWTGRDGRLAISRIPPGRYRLSARAEDGRGFSAVSPEFAVSGDIVDLGELPLHPEWEGTLVIEGLQAWSDIDCEFFLVPFGSEDRLTKLYLMRTVLDRDTEEVVSYAGEFVLVVCDQGGNRLWSSPRFTIPGEDGFEVTVRLPAPTVPGSGDR